MTAWICSPESLVPGARSSSTDAVGLRLLGHEDLVLGQRDVHDGLVDALERLEGVGELALERPLVGDLLLELAGGDALLVEQRVAGVLAGRQALAAHLQAQVVDLVLGDHDRLAAVGERVRDAARR